MTMQRGFTLLEMLIGMTLLGFILALLFAGFRLASDSWDAVSARTETTANEQLGRALLRRLLTQAQPMRWKKAAGQPLTFAGEKKVLRAIAPISGQAGSGGLRVIELAIEAGDKVDGPLRLVLRHAPLRYDAEQFADNLAGAETRPVLVNLGAAEFGYFGAEKRDDPPRWLDAWTNTEQLPRLIAIRVSGREPGWADIVIAPLVADNRWATGAIVAGPF